MGIRKNYQLVAVQNSGDIMSGAEIILKAKGTVTNPVITDVFSTEQIKINKTMQAGEQVIINTVAGSKTIKGIVDGVESNYFKYWDYSSKWLQFQVGYTLLGYTAENETYKSLDMKVNMNQEFFSLKGQ